MPRAQSADGVIHDFPDGTDPAVIDRVMKAYATEQAPHTTAGGLAAAAGRGLAPIAAGAGLGAAAGAPFAGVGAIPGALAGAGAAGLAEVAVPGYNFIARHTGLPEAPTPSQATDKLLDALGIKRPSTPAERATESVAGDVGIAALGAMPTPRKSFATTAGRLAGNEEKADALRAALAQAVPGGDKGLVSRLTNRLVDVGIGGELLHFLSTGDLGAVIRALGMTGAREVYLWSRSPTRRLDQLEKIIERQQRSVDPFRTAP